MHSLRKIRSPVFLALGLRFAQTFLDHLRRHPRRLREIRTREACLIFSLRSHREFLVRLHRHPPCQCSLLPYLHLRPLSAKAFSLFTLTTCCASTMCATSTTAACGRRRSVKATTR